MIFGWNSKRQKRDIYEAEFNEENGLGLNSLEHCACTGVNSLPIHQYNINVHR